MNCIIMQLMLIVCRDIIKVSKLLGEEHTQGPRRYSVVPQECLSVTMGGWWWGRGAWHLTLAPWFLCIRKCDGTACQVQRSLR